MKNVVPGEFEYNQDIQKKVSSYPNLRTAVDTIQSHELFVYPFLKEDLLSLCRKSPSEKTKRNILKSALRGLAGLHDQNIVHNGRF